MQLFRNAEARAFHGCYHKRSCRGCAGVAGKRAWAWVGCSVEMSQVTIRGSGKRWQATGLDVVPIRFKSSDAVEWWEAGGRDEGMLNGEM